MRIQRAERLVHQQDRRIEAECARQSHALAHALGQRLRIGVFEALQACLDDGGRDTLSSFGVGYAGELQAIADIVGHRAPGKQRIALEDVADVGRRLAGDDGLAVDQNLAAGRLHQRGDHVEDRALSTA